MVKLTEVEDEHFTTEKPVPTNKDSLLVSDNEEDEDYTDTGTFLSFSSSLLTPSKCYQSVRIRKKTRTQNTNR